MKRKVFFTGLFSIIVITTTIIHIIITDRNVSFSKQNGENATSIVAYASRQKEFPLLGGNGSVDSLLRFIEQNPALKKDNNLQYLSTVRISKKWDSIGNAYYFVEATPDFVWGTGLYLIITDDYEIVKVVDTGLGGYSEFFSYEIVSMSQGDFLAVYCSAHTGNGELVLAPITEMNRTKYIFTDAIDDHYECMRSTAIEYGLAPEHSQEVISGEIFEEDEDGHVEASTVYLGGKLHADYFDVDQDGNTDVVLTGIQRVYETGNNNEQILKQEYYVKNVFLYNPEIDGFILNNELSMKTMLMTY